MSLTSNSVKSISLASLEEGSRQGILPSARGRADNNENAIGPQEEFVVFVNTNGLRGLGSNETLVEQEHHGDGEEHVEEDEHTEEDGTGISIQLQRKMSRTTKMSMIMKKRRKMSMNLKMLIITKMNSPRRSPVIQSTTTNLGVV